MKELKNVTKMLVLILMLSFVPETEAPIVSDNVLTVQAATAKGVKLNAAKKTLFIGNSFQLKITGTKKIVAWSSSKKAVATVSKKGKVTAKSEGTAIITAKVDSKKYTCKITVKAISAQYVKEAPFPAKEVQCDHYTLVIPKDWRTMDVSEENESILFCYPDVDDISAMDQLVGILTMAYKDIDLSEDEYNQILENPDVKKVVMDKTKDFMGEYKGIHDITLSFVKKGSNCYIMADFLLDTASGDIESTTIYYHYNDGYLTVIDPATNSKDLSSTQNVVDYILTSLTFEK